MNTKSWAWGVGGIVFDAVGTLIEPRPSVAEVYRAAAFRQGIELDAGEVRRRFHQHFRKDEDGEALGPLTTSEPAEYERWRHIVSDVLPELPDPDGAFAELWDHFADPESWVCFADVPVALDRLRASGLRLCIGSNFDARLRSVAAGLPELAGLVPDVVISSEVGYRKPHARFFEAACEVLGLPPGEVLCVGDDLVNDFHGATRAGLKAVLLERRKGRDGLEVPRISGLEELLG